MNPPGCEDPNVQPPRRYEPSGLGASLRAKVLIVDDDERNAFAAVQALESLGHDLVVARSGAEALRCLLQDEFAVILLDLHMPGMDGYETAALIRSRRKTRTTPIVFVTAIYRDETHIFQAYSAGAVDMVFKPVDPFILRSKVSVLVDIYLRTEEARLLAAHRQWLLEENARIQAAKVRTEQALRRSEAHQEAILKSLPLVVHARSAEPPFATLFVSDTVEAITGFTPEPFLQQADFGASRIHPDDLDRVVEAIAGASRTGGYACEFRWLCADGSYRWLTDQGVLAPAGDNGERQIFGVIVDSTERHSLEEQLAQARKMEAVGQLTGGLAHDFNNLLTVVLGNIDIMARRAEEGEKRALRIDAVRQAAERGRDLTMQLLAFSRRQNLSPVTVDICDLVRNFAPLLHQAVGEAVSIELDLPDQPMCSSIDVTQLETALLNLAVNARDAMPEGGSLRLAVKVAALENSAAPARAAICLSVEDTGTGMSPEVRDRIFEPFFTTKEIGRGSGLGLSQVYGFVRQSDGEVRISSEPGAGSRFEILLPASAEPAQVRPAPISSEKMVGGSERILIAEDDPAVLTLAVDLLQGLGYDVVTAGTGDEALKIVRADPSIQLLFSDIVMPGGASGVTLAREARALRPELPVLLTSGFTAEPTLLQGVTAPILHKPYAAQALASKLRELLDAPNHRPRRKRPAATAKSNSRKTISAETGNGAA